MIKLYSMVEWMHEGLATKRSKVQIWSENSRTTKEGRTKAGKEKKKKADDSHHPEAKQTGYNQT